MANRSTTRNPYVSIARLPTKLACRRRNVGEPISNTPGYLESAPDCKTPLTAFHASFFKFTIGDRLRLFRSSDEGCCPYCFQGRLECKECRCCRNRLSAYRSKADRCHRRRDQ